MKLKKLHEDERGSVYSLTGFYRTPEITIFETKAGYARGGCIHRINDERSLVIEGEIRFVVNGLDGVIMEGGSVLIPAGKPHYFVSLTDSVVMEWGATSKEKKEKHPEFRKVVEEINAANKTDIH